MKTWLIFQSEIEKSVINIGLLCIFRWVKVLIHCLIFHAMIVCMLIQESWNREYPISFHYFPLLDINFSEISITYCQETVKFLKNSWKIYNNSWQQVFITQWNLALFVHSERRHVHAWALPTHTKVYIKTVWIWELYVNHLSSDEDQSSASIHKMCTSFLFSSWHDTIIVSLQCSWNIMIEKIAMS